ncbi:Aste57867_9146 [Aphanomyces stellatus]|uniref:Aste57867_9146 protein n=1 Tax=Aphanomyces stellatus TaxID=120398 RepID=A0A485KMB9_9STRA|nr:hypothetical protein As57867_009110 [Aphanomyces stellatus]VFT86030.1 Aste57867_9146 [Aphanomyces stellatus]
MAKQAPVYDLLLSVTPSQLDVLEPALLNLWEFGPDALDPVSPAMLRQWVLHGELAVALTLKPDAPTLSIHEALEHAIDIGQPCDDVEALGTCRMVCLHGDALRMRSFLLDHGCPPSVFSSTNASSDSFVSHGRFHMDSQSFEPSTESSVHPVDLHHDVITYASTAFVHKSARGLGVHEKLSLTKSLSFMPLFKRTVQRGHTCYCFFVTSDHDAGAKIALAHMKASAAFVASVGAKLTGQAIKSINVTHWQTWDPVMHIHTRAYLVSMDDAGWRPVHSAAA